MGTCIIQLANWHGNRSTILTSLGFDANSLDLTEWFRTLTGEQVQHLAEMFGLSFDDVSGDHSTSTHVPCPGSATPAAICGRRRGYSSVS